MMMLQCTLMTIINQLSAPRRAVKDQRREGRPTRVTIARVQTVEALLQVRKAQTTTIIIKAIIIPHSTVATMSHHIMYSKTTSIDQSWEVA